MSADLFKVAVQDEASPEQLGEVSKCIREALMLQALIEDLTEQVKAATASYNELRHKKLPELMNNAKMDSTVVEGYEIALKQVVSGSLPNAEKFPAKRKKAIDWLVSHDGGDLIKTEVELIFSRSQHNEALSIAKEMEERGQTVKLSSGVNAQTLYAWTRERLINGEPINAEVLGLTIMEVADISKVKETATQKLNAAARKARAAAQAKPKGGKRGKK